MTTAIQAIQQKLDNNELIIIDGGTGTELQNRGAAMHGDVWCGVATLNYGELLQSIHEDYIRVGASLITTNTFSSNRNMLGPAGFGDQVEEINRKATEIALRARDNAAADHPVVVAGSMSHQVPVVRGADYRNPDTVPSADSARGNFAEQAEILAEAGADLILLEMMSDPDLAAPAIDAAIATGLPVWVGLSCRRLDNGDIVSSSRRELLFAEAARQFLPSASGAIGAVGVMHSHVPLISPALTDLRDIWKGPLMAYPDSGYFRMPDWQFDDIIPPQELADVARTWIEQHDVRVIGGCCGLGVDHIASLVRALR